ncbi:MAG TPA: PTS transporter subunit EIIC [Candidatus Coprousia avicola]|nr:PTS transporter subunit EIIC [Candidatus Coprousia avicola]
MPQNDVQAILDLVGGPQNVVSAAHCLTRLRLELRDNALVKEEQIKELPLVKGVIVSNGQYQIIIGPGTVNKVHQEFVELAGIKDEKGDAARTSSSQHANILQRVIKALGDIFIPILPAIVASGLLMGLNNLITNPGIFYADQSVLQANPAFEGVANMIALIANTAFQYLPALVGWSAVKKFGGNPVLGIVLGLIMINPALMPAPEFAKNPVDATYWNLFGWQIAKVGYQGQVIPVLCSAFILAKTENFLTKHIPDLVQMILVSPLALLFTGFVTFTVVGPVTLALSNFITDGILALFGISPIIAGFIFGALVSPLVVTGMHHLFLGVNVQMIGALGYCTLWPIQVMASIGQGAASFMIFLLEKNKKMRSIALPAAISAWLGITEPAIFGVNLRYKYPFVAEMIGAGCAGAIVAAADVKAISIGISGLPAPLSIMPEYWTIYFIAMAVSIGVTMALTFIFHKAGFGKKNDAEVEAELD